jgi:competence protein ComEA
MLKKILAATAMLFAVASWAAVDANKATEADLDGLKGVGPALSKRILEERKQGEFKDWSDFMSRVKGVKEKSAAKLSAEGLTINRQALPQAAEHPVKDEPKKTATAAAKAPAKQ